MTTGRRPGPRSPRGAPALSDKKTVNLHPIVTLGGVIIGAFLTVPLIAVGWAVWKAVEVPPAPADGTPNPAPT